MFGEGENIPDEGWVRGGAAGVGVGFFLFFVFCFVGDLIKRKKVLTYFFNWVNQLSFLINLLINIFLKI